MRKNKIISKINNYLNDHCFFSLLQEVIKKNLNCKRLLEIFQSDYSDLQLYEIEIESYLRGLFEVFRGESCFIDYQFYFAGKEIRLLRV